MKNFSLEKSIVIQTLYFFEFQLCFLTHYDLNLHFQTMGVKRQFQFLQCHYVNPFFVTIICTRAEKTRRKRSPFKNFDLFLFWCAAFPEPVLTPEIKGQNRQNLSIKRLASPKNSDMQCMTNFCKDSRMYFEWI